MAPAEPLPVPSSENCEQELVARGEYFETQQAYALAGARRLLGDELDVSDADTRDDLRKNASRALEALERQAIGRLRSAARLAALAKLSEDEIDRAESLIETILAQAHEITALAEHPERAARLRLYARVANWLKQEGHESPSIEDCPICHSDLQRRADPVTGEPIIDHICRYLEADCEHLENTIAAWADLALQTVSAELSHALPARDRPSLPDSPSELISRALCDELFQTPAFSGELASLRRSATQLCEKHLRSLGTFVEPPAPNLPADLKADHEPLFDAIKGLQRTIAFARWRKANQEACGVASRAIIGTKDSIPDMSVVGETDLKDRPLLAQLSVLEKLVADTEPLRTAAARIADMRGTLDKRRGKEKRIARYTQAAKALEDLLPLGEIVDQQIETLLNSLATETTRWKKELYRPAYVNAPSIAGAGAQKDGSLVVDATSEGTTVAAQHVCNASDLRATLLAFLFGLWKHLLKEHGGLSLILLDDLQELFDPHNRRRVADAVALMVEEGAAIVLTTNDHDFAGTVASAGKKHLSVERVGHRVVQPTNAVDLRITLSKLLEEIHRRRLEFERNTNDHRAARTYLNELRIYLEDRLRSFFDTRDSGMPANPTLSDLVNAVRRRVNAGQEPLTAAAFRKMASAPALRTDAEFTRLMNRSHHGQAHLITYNDVLHVYENSKRVLELVHSAHEQYERWLRREPPHSPSAKPTPLPPERDLSFRVPQIEATAAAAADSPVYEVVEADEPFSCDWLANHAVYINATDNFGFAGGKNCRVIVDLADSQPDDQSWVIALHRNQIYARRLLRYSKRLEEIVLAAESSNPLNRPPTLVLPASEVRLLKVVGLLFHNTPRHRRCENEAELDEQCQILRNVEIAFKVRGQSALPLVLEKQTVLGGQVVLPAELPSLIGEMVALDTSGGCAFKRVGEVLPGAEHVRQFESIGGLGESLLVRTEAIENDPFHGLPLLRDTREILGVLYSPDA